MVSIRLWVLLAFSVLLVTSSLHAREPLKTKPHISLSFPFAEVADGIGITNPVAINSTTILTPDDVLRIIYVPLSEEDARVVKEQRLDEREVAYTRHHQLNALETDEQKLSPGARALLKMVRETHWDNKKMFMLALANQPGDDLRIVHANRETMELKDSAINLPNGLLVTSHSGVLKVLAVEVGTRGEKAGLRANDIILQVNGERMGSDLSAFLSAMAQGNTAAKASTGRSYKMVVQNIEEDAPREAVFQLPPSLTTGFLDQPIIIDETVPKKEAKPAMPDIDTWRKTPKRN